MTCSVEVLVRSYLDHLAVERGMSANTLDSYRRDLRRYAGFVGAAGVVDADQVDPGLIARYAMSLAEPVDDKPGLAAASVARAVVVVRNLHRFGAEEGLTTTNPAADIQPPRLPKRLPKALSSDQVFALLAATDPTTPAGVRDRALLELLYGTGARISELMALDVDDITRVLRETGPDSDPGWLHVLGKGNKERMVPLGRFARSALEDYLVRGRPALMSAGTGTPALFVNTRGARMTRQSAWLVLQAAANRAGLEQAISPHTLRHSFATHLLDGGADVRVVQELLGHASVTTTQIYTLVTVDHLREVYLTAHPRAHHVSVTDSPSLPASGSR